MNLSEAVKQWEVCMSRPTKIYGCLFEDCPLHKNVTIETGNSIEGVATLRIEACHLVGKIESLLRQETKSLASVEQEE
ncbi:unnamed protein product [marine sediment metagenome]|uniref:Uncharacterized protein n=1 Tax=marine sediment metagenome TaxID=412755 RepID=X1VJB9_9ZZZZ